MYDLDIQLKISYASKLELSVFVQEELTYNFNDCFCFLLCACHG